LAGASGAVAFFTFGGASTPQHAVNPVVPGEFRCRGALVSALLTAGLSNASLGSRGRRSDAL
jgi:hypothetical protein